MASVASTKTSLPDDWLEDLKYVTTAADLETAVENIDNSLDWLENITCLEIRQEVELMETLGCCETLNKYALYTGEGQHVAEAKEHRRCCCGFCIRQCCEARRGFTISVKAFGSGVSFICKRWFKPWVGCCPPVSPCMSDQLRVYAVNGDVIADCREACTCIRAKYKIEDADGDVKLRAYGPWCMCCCYCCCKGCCECCTDVTFKIEDRGGNKLGTIKKKWGGFVKEALTDADTFVLEIDTEMSVKFKAALIGLAFLIDFMHFEDNSYRKKTGKGLQLIDS